MHNRIVSAEEWLPSRLQLLQKEKELTRLREKLAEERRRLPWMKVEKDYFFDAPGGKVSLGDLFEGRNQLVVYHFMFHPDWEQGCKSCSLLADHYNPAIVHLNHRDVSMVTVSRAPLPKLQAFKKRMGWSFQWVSSHDNDFNRDFNVTFTEEEIQRRTPYYNYATGPFPLQEAPGISVFARDEAGNIYHTYSSYARGLESFIGTYDLLDIVPKGRDEEADAYPMQWLRHHDRYGAEDPFAFMVAGGKP
ncbi:DUF899 domain-containing protein [Geothrix fermentans]|uniref:DUF899 domain-containing protein n=1 Tax=Geothrix fermentans TaxID=44676 RepID=UPI0004134AE6|nr:thioredoxin family protein [Geothrix fermentans]